MNGLLVAYLLWLFGRAALALRHPSSRDAAIAKPLDPDTLTIAQPILSGDPLLEARLRETLAALPRQRFIWLVDEHDDAGGRLAESIASDRVRIDCCPPCPDGINPKTWKLCRAVPLATTPYFAVIDDDTVISEPTASALVVAAREASVATGLPWYENGGDLPSALLAQFVNNNAIFSYLATSALLAPFTLNGMGYVMRTVELERLGGFDPILGELTDDLALASLVRRMGGRIHQDPAPMRVRTGVADFGHYVALMHRWHVFACLLLRRQPLARRLAIMALQGPPPFLLWALLLAAAVNAGSPLSCAALATVLVARGIVLAELQEHFFGSPLHRPVLSILSELLQPLHLVHALCSRTIRWRTRRYRVRDSDDFSPA